MKTLIALCLICSAAHAQLGPDTHLTDANPKVRWNKQQVIEHIGGVPGRLTQAPEIDPTWAGSGLTLLLGGIAILKSRRRPSP